MESKEIKGKKEEVEVFSEEDSSTSEDENSKEDPNKDLCKMKEFDELKPTTMTLVCYLSGTIYIVNAFDLLPVVRVELPEEALHKKKKIKIPHHSVPGSFLSVRFFGSCRGIVKSARSFKNSITADISVADKNLSIKLSANKIHITGATSESQGYECCNYIIGHLNKIQEELNYITLHPEECEEAISWLMRNSCSFNLLLIKKLILDKEEDGNSNSKKEKKKGKDEDKKVESIPKKFEFVSKHELVNAPYLMKLREEYFSRFPHLSTRILDFMLSYYGEFQSYEDFMMALSRYSSIDTVISPQEVKVLHIQKVMVNYNYDLGFKIDRKQLIMHLNMRNDPEFKAYYNNVIEHTVTVKMPYNIAENQLPDEIKHMEQERKMLEEDLKKPKKKKKADKPEKPSKKHQKHDSTILFYRTGRVTQSSPCQSIGRVAYNKLKSAIMEIQHEIVTKED